MSSKNIMLGWNSVQERHRKIHQQPNVNLAELMMLKPAHRKHKTLSGVDAIDEITARPVKEAHDQMRGYFVIECLCPDVFLICFGCDWIIQPEGSPHKITRDHINSGICLQQANTLWKKCWFTSLGSKSLGELLTQEAVNPLSNHGTV